MRRELLEQEAPQLIAISTLLIALQRELSVAINYADDQEASLFYYELYEQIDHMLNRVLDTLSSITESTKHSFAHA